MNIQVVLLYGRLAGLVGFYHTTQKWWNEFYNKFSNRSKNFETECVEIIIFRYFDKASDILSIYAYLKYRQ